MVFSIMQTDQPCYGVLRITNPRTLEMWKKTGKYQKLIDEGYIYAKRLRTFQEWKFALVVSVAGFLRHEPYGYSLI